MLNVLVSSNRHGAKYVMYGKINNGILVAMDCNPGLVFPMPEFGIDDFVILEFRQHDGISLRIWY